MEPETVRAAVARYFAAIRQMDADAWVACFAEQATSYEPGAPAPLQGHAALRQFFLGVVGAFEKVGLTEDHVFLSGNRAAVKFTGRGIGKNGRSVVFEGIDVFEIHSDGRIHTMWGYWNPAAMLAQLQG
ncbi:MAG: nuclear transport factor 2 family protein [Nitrospira sp.]|nr:nuclear transport factor 2 family protein [Nitrospira sp.]